MNPVPAFVAFARLDLVDALRSRWLAFTCAAYVGLFSLFLWLGLHESSVLGFTGLSRVVLNLSNAIVVIAPLLALIATSQSIVRARTTGLLELLLAQPCRRDAWFAGLLVARLAMLLGPLALLLALVVAVGVVQGGDEPLVAIGAKTLAISSSLVWAFAGVGLFVSAGASTAERALVQALVVWATASALHDFLIIGALLRAHLPAPLVFALAAVNPVEAARVGILASVDPELSILGPVGFWLANKLGSTVAFAVGVGWPLLLGTAAVVGAAFRLRRADVVP